MDAHIQTVKRTPTADAHMMSHRALLVQRASSRLPVTAEGLPVGYYRVDLLPLTPQRPEEEVIALRNAYVDLSFANGYPTLTDGRAYWLKFDFEPGFSYGCFQAYLEMDTEGSRDVYEVAGSEELIRLFLQTADGEHYAKRPRDEQQRYVARHLLEYSVLYQWKPRARAYDLYKEAAYRHLRLKRQMNMENKHFEMSERYLKELEEKVFGSPDFWKDMPQKVAIDLLSKLVGIQRVSTGLPAAGPLAQKETPEDTSLEMIFRSLGRKSEQGSGRTFDADGRSVPGRSILQDVLQDPDATRNLQEVILRVSRTQRRAPEDAPGAGRTFRSRIRTEEPISEDDIAPYDITGAPGTDDADLNDSDGSNTGTDG